MNIWYVLGHRRSFGVLSIAALSGIIAGLSRLVGSHVSKWNSSRGGLTFLEKVEKCILKLLMSLASEKQEAIFALLFHSSYLICLANIQIPQPLNA
jgi:hypothetical protein